MPSDLSERLFKFSVRVLRFCRTFPRGDAAAQVVGPQLGGSASAVGANYEEGQGSGTRRDFHAKARIALKEAREALYWSRVARESALGDPAEGEAIRREADEIVAILTTIVRRVSAPQDGSQLPGRKP